MKKFLDRYFLEILFMAVLPLFVGVTFFIISKYANQMESFADSIEGYIWNFKDIYPNLFLGLSTGLGTAFLTCMFIMIIKHD